MSLALERTGQKATRVPSVLSDFCWRQLTTRPEVASSPPDLASFRQTIRATSSAEELKSLLRRDRNHRMVHWIARQCRGVGETAAVASELSAYADLIVTEVSEWIQEQFAGTWGRPVDANGRGSVIVVMAMGKLGGRELNLSSDIDLVFAHADGVRIEGGARSIEPEVYFQRFVRLFSDVVASPTADGFVFRVDTRLRPFGRSGPPVASFAFLNQYYQVHARGWERFALLKMRPVGGLREHRHELLKLLKPFVFRRYIDYSVLDTPRELKRKIVAEHRKRPLDAHLKLGPGGIRDIEFVVQCFQLIYGGRQPALQVTSTAEALSALAELSLLPDNTVSGLQDAYWFLRCLEHGVQAFRDEQVHELPTSSLDRERLCVLAGVDDWDALLAVLEGHRRTVREVFDGLLETERTGAGDPPPECDLEEMASEAFFRQAGFAEPEAAAAAMRQLLAAIDKRSSRIGPRGRARLKQLLPELIALCAGYADSHRVWQDWCGILMAVATRTAYLDLFWERPATRVLLSDLMAASGWVAREVQQHPWVVDELLSPAFLNIVPSRSDVADDLHARLLRLPAEAEEEQWEVLREFRRQWVFRLGVAFAAGHLEVGELGKGLSAVADTIILSAVELAADRVRSKLPGDALPGVFGVIAYGKLGAGELTVKSDLDLVFVYKTGESGSHLEPETVFTQLARRLLQILTTRTINGELYQVDTRLRPSGRAGLLVVDTDAFEKYQREDAWTWEHQALVKARMLSGSAELVSTFEALRKRILAAQRRPERVAEEIRTMRQKMQQAAPPAESGTALKWIDGGLIDVEFLAQYLVLSHASAHQRLLEPRRTVDILRTAVEEGLLEPQLGAELVRHYLALLEVTNQLAMASSADWTALLPACDRMSGRLRQLGL
jgi:glutamate-ammonia-ligase adenylyltransferase